MLRLLGTKGYRYMMFHNNFSRQDLMGIIGSLSEGHEPADQRIKWLYKELSSYVNRLDEVSAFLKGVESKQNEIVSEACEKAKRYLPESAEIEADIYLVIGGDDAYGANLIDTRAIVMNVGLFASKLQEMIAILAHELHHKADNQSLEVYWRFQRKGPKDLARLYSIVSELIGEGVATLVTFPLGLASKYFATKENIDREYNKVESGIQQMSLDITDERANEIFENLYANAGPLYMVGCDMAKKIEEILGRDTLVAAIQEPLQFFQAYNESVIKSGEGYGFSVHTTRLIQRLQDEINRM